jgi:hypothetical protein
MPELQNHTNSEATVTSIDPEDDLKLLNSEASFTCFHPNDDYLKITLIGVWSMILVLFGNYSECTKSTFSISRELGSNAEFDEELKIMTVLSSLCFLAQNSNLNICRKCRVSRYIYIYKLTYHQRVNILYL